jgi:hypothetical protein
LSGRFSGDESNRNFPGVNNDNPIVYFPGNLVYMRFYSDGSRTDWGYRMAAFPVDEVPAEPDPLEEFIQKIGGYVMIE